MECITPVRGPRTDRPPHSKRRATDVTTIETAPDTTLDSVNPATGEVLATYPIADEDAVRAAVAKARKAAKVWGALSFDERRKHLLRWSSRLVADADEFCELIHKENGKPRDDAFLELMLALEHIARAAKNSKKYLAPKKISPGAMMSNFSARQASRPLGGVGVIGPWSYPVYTPIGSIGCALAAGNTVVFKPSEYSTGIGV